MPTTATNARPSIGFNPDPDHAVTLPSHYYWDREIFQREKEEIWFKTWQFAAHLNDLRNPGDYITTEIFDQKIVLVRGKDARLRGFYNVCMHRGHILAEGKGNKTIYTCPFHAWSYDTTGALKAAGNSENVAGFRLEDFTLSEIRVEEYANMAFFNLDPDAVPLRQLAAGLEEDFRDRVQDFDKMTSVRLDARPLQCNWKYILDQNECYHCPILHPNVGFGSRKKTRWINEQHDYWSRHISRADPEEIDNTDSILPKADDDSPLKYETYIWFLWPNLVFLSHRGAANFKLQLVMPTGPEDCVFSVESLCLNDPPADADVDGMNFYWDIVVPQDVGAMEAQQLGSHSRGYTQGRLMVDQERGARSEHAVHHFDDLVWRALNGPNYD